ncbi:MAG: GGDEF domain-containing protein [Gammaproteobacteria bacterium]|nr:GGDEF domain-containing protein [Gammaproteobacteria bacterium]
MNGQYQQNAEKLNKLANPPARYKINSDSRKRFASKVLALTGILQTTLETNELIALFGKELRKFVNFDGIVYQLPELEINIELGHQSPHHCDYQLVVSSEELGDLQLFRFYPFKESELEIIENLMAGLLYPLRNALLYYRALQTALIDPLTGVKNRATMDTAIHREIELARRQDTTLSVILLDIDHFKQVNDQYGHLSGDQALRAIAQCANRTIRDSDMLFRYGGEEFLVLLTGTDSEGALQLAERIRENVEQLNPHKHETMALTVSLGVTSLEPDDDSSALFQRADKALYQAKQKGRNRVIAN